jgi:predicted metal-dependent hydrolase
MQIDRLIRSKRKSIALIVEADGRLVVCAPMRATRRQIEAMIAQHEGWIKTRQEAAKAAAPAIRRYASGEEFWYLGRLYGLELVEQADEALELREKFRLRRAEAARGEAVFTAWYRRQARQVLCERAMALAERHGLRYEELKITSAQRRWGSCSSRGSLCFSWRLAMAPLEVIDYVVVHELAHLKVRSHAKKFWDLVGEMAPDYRERRAWLKNNGQLFRL